MAIFFIKLSTEMAKYLGVLQISAQPEKHLLIFVSLQKQSHIHFLISLLVYGTSIGFVSSLAFLARSERNESKFLSDCPSAHSTFQTTYNFSIIFYIGDTACTESFGSNLILIRNGKIHILLEAMKQKSKLFSKTTANRKKNER